MKFGRIVTDSSTYSLALAAILGLAAASPCQATPVTNVVFGNLGASGTNSVTDQSTSTDGYLMAQGFTAAAPRLTVQSVGLWLSGSSTTASVSIYDATSLFPAGGPGDPVATSASQTVGAKGLYQFSFSGVELMNGTNYWIVPDNGVVSWFLAGGAPTQQNASGYAFTGTLARPDGGFWQPAATDAMSVSMSVVPEPSTYALCLAGLACGGSSMVHRRRRR